MASVNDSDNKKDEKEGNDLLGQPTFTELPNGRLKCVETGHELVSKDKESYSQSKRCRLGLLDYGLAHKKTPLNLFKQDPLSRSKLICKLTGDTVNKSEEHIWKHINGRRFLYRLEQKELEKLGSKGMESEDVGGELKKESKGVKKKKKQKKEKRVEEIITEVKDSSDKDSEFDDDFWMPPAGERWDFDDGKDRWGSDVESGPEDEQENEAGDDAVEDSKDTGKEDTGKESEELSKRKKRMSTEIEPSSLASGKKKKKSKKNATS